MDSDLTLRDLLNRAHHNTPVDVQLRLSAATTQQEMLIQVERAVDWSIKRLAQNRKHHQGTTEDQRTVALVDMIGAMGIPAKHDAEIGGHTDISIELRDGFLWLAEAKNWTGASWIFKGYRQLMTRYATGMPNQDQGAIIIYFEQEGAAKLMDKWKKSLGDRAAFTAATENIDGITFRTTHNHRGVGQPYYVKHLGVPLYWRPEDS